MESHIRSSNSALAGISKDFKNHQSEVGAKLHSLENTIKECQDKLSDSFLEGRTREFLAPHFDRITAAINALKIEQEELEISSNERRDIVQRYKIGTVERLRQDLQELEKKISERDREISEKTLKIDSLEREKILSSMDHSTVPWTKFQDLNAKYETAIRENGELHGYRAECERLALINQELQSLEETYRQNIANASRNFDLEKWSKSQEETITNLTYERGQHLETITSLQKENSRLRSELYAVRASYIKQGQDLLSEQEKAFKLERDLQPLRENEEAVKQERLEISAQKTDLNAQLRNERAEQKHEYDSYRAELEQNVEARLKDQLEKKHHSLVESLNNEVRDLRERYMQSNIARKAALEEKEKFDRDKSATLEDLASLVERNKTLSEERRRLEIEVGDLKTRIGGFKEEEAGLEKRCGLLQKDLEDLIKQRNSLGKRVDRETRIESIVAPCFADVPRAEEWTGTETEWLKELERSIEKKADFVFPQRLLYAFHTSLKTADISQLTVLAGVSGTGKSELPKLYAHFGGFNFLPVPVQATWDSPQDIFGFYDYLECRYKATPFLRALVQSQSNGQHGFSDGLLLILLDEMNLARVELYFSELLSRLESRRNISSSENSVLSQMDIDIGAGEAPYSFSLGRNVMYVGTINEDETTMTLSDKVLDRGNVITFPRPTALHSRRVMNQLPEKKFRLARSTWNQWVCSPQEGLSEEVGASLKEDLQQVNSALSEVNRAIGHRVLQAIEAYVANYPGVRENPQSWKVPFADQIVQRIMPKLRGIEVNSAGGGRCIEGVRRVVKNYDIAGDFEASLDSSEGVFIWASSKYIEAPCMA